MANGSGAIPPGWIGGFAQSNPKFAYPTPDLSSLPLYDNMANINLLQRQQKVCWPEFSWRTVLADETSRCFQMFSPDISRVGYTDKGRVYSIICPQQGVYHPHLGTLNIEVTVTGNRGWVDEKAPKDANVAADLTTLGPDLVQPGRTPEFVGQVLVDVVCQQRASVPVQQSELDQGHAPQQPE